MTKLPICPILSHYLKSSWNVISNSFLHDNRGRIILNFYQYSLFIISPFLAYLFSSTFPFQILKYFCLYKAYPIYPKMEEGFSVNWTIWRFLTDRYSTKIFKLIFKLIIGNTLVQIVIITLILDLYGNQRMYIKLHSPSYEPYSDCDHLIPRDHPFSTVSEMIPCDHLII